MRAAPYPKGMSNLDRKLLKAFGRGKMASDNWEPRSLNPHFPSGAPYAAWDCGWCEGEDVYTLPAQGIEARQGGNGEAGAIVDESPVAEGDVPE